MNRKILFIFVIVAMMLSLTGCATEDTAAQDRIAELEAQLAAASAEGATAEDLAALEADLAAAEDALAEVQAELVNTEVDFVTWYQYDETNEDPASDERVGNEYLRNSIPAFNEEFEGKWNWVNRPKAFDKMYLELVAAVIAGNKVPDIIEIGSMNVSVVYNNAAVQDLRAWAEQQDWWDDLDASAVASCTMPDGGLYCIPVAIRPHLVYVWADHYPNGFPTTPEQFVEEAERLKAEGTYAWTYFGSTAFGGSGASRMYNTVIQSFGGSYDDGEGNLYLTSPETVEAIEFLRMTVMNGYNPETVFAGGFIEEDSFKDASAAAIPTGLFGYRYINPLTAPDGTAYDTGSADDMINAIADGQVVLAPMFAPEGKTPGCGNDVQGFAIPVGAENVEAAYDYINWVMTPEQNAAFVLGPGAGFPANTAILSDPQLDLPFYREAAKALEQSVCTPWYGSIDERREEAAETIVNVIYKLIKEDQTADILTELKAAEDSWLAGQ
jgi:multiple sugar transport system substrate-binding protein